MPCTTHTKPMSRIYQENMSVPRMCTSGDKESLSQCPRLALKLLEEKLLNSMEGEGCDAYNEINVIITKTKLDKTSFADKRPQHSGKVLVVTATRLWVDSCQQ